MAIRNIDIIIPVFNGYEDIQICLNSIKKYTNLEDHRVILINDKSTDDKILPFLKSQENDNVILLENEQNKGFSASINRGIAYSDRDVILLNSDTIVTQNWVEKIISCAYREASIATVTPLSNSATLCSIPVFCQDNELSKYITIDEYASMIQDCSLKVYPTIPVAVGFCMYIKREVMNIVGMFDADTFGRGYGEENDFCHRAEMYGYHHVMCDDTFVYHKGTVSFQSGEKKQLIQEHTAIIEERYPKQNRALHDFCLRNPHQFIRDNIYLYMAAQNGKKNILYLLQSDFREETHNHLGGTQFHVKDLTEHLKADYNVFVMARDEEELRLTLYTDKEMISFKFYIGSKPSYPIFYSSNLEGIFRAVLDSYSIDYVHIHHVMDVSLDLFHVAHERKIPIVASIHDFYYVAPDLYQRSNNDDRDYINTGELEASQMQLISVSDKWRTENHKALSICDKIVFPSNSTRELFLGYYRDLESKCTVIEHGRDFAYTEPKTNIGNVIISKNVIFNIDNLFNNPLQPDEIVGWALLDKSNNRHVNVYLEATDSLNNVRIFRTEKIDRYDVSEMKGSERYLNTGFRVNTYKLVFASGEIRMRVLLEYKDKFYTDGNYIKYNYLGKSINQSYMNIAFVGTVVKEKGSQLIGDLVRQTKTGINWFVMGAATDKDLFDLEQENLYALGGYNRDEIFDLLKQFQIDLVCILSQVPETFCYTLSEAWLCNIPVIASDIGAVGERIKKSGAGFLIPVSAKADEVMNLIYAIRNDKALYEEAKSKILSSIARPVSSMVDSYKELYNSFKIYRKERREFDASKMFEGYKRANINTSIEEERLSDLIKDLESKNAESSDKIHSLRKQLIAATFLNRQLLEEMDELVKDKRDKNKMINNFFNVANVRIHILDNDILIVEGWFEKNNPENNQVKLFLDDIELSYEIHEYSGITVRKKFIAIDSSVDTEYHLHTKLPVNFKLYKNLYIYTASKNGDKMKLSHNISTKRISGMKRRFPYCIDSVEYVKDEKKFLIKGWAISNNVINYKVTTLDGVEEKISVNFTSRIDAAESLKEIEVDPECGFEIAVKANSLNRWELKMTSGKHEVLEPIRGEKKVGESNIIRIKLNYRFIINKTFRYLKANGFIKTIKKIISKLKRQDLKVAVVDYDKWRIENIPTKQELEEQRSDIFLYNPKFSIVVPLYKTPENYLNSLIDSIKEQTYADWELCLSDGSGVDSPLTSILNAYEQQEKRIKVIHNGKQLRISENTNEAIKAATGDFIVFGDHDDLLAPDALYECVKALNENKEIEILYTDEDKISMDGKRYFQPHFKPDFNIDLLRSMNYISHLLVVSKSIVAKIGILNPEYDGAQDYDYTLRCIEVARNIYHIPKILYHWRAHMDSTAEKPESKMYAFKAGELAIAAHYKRTGINAQVSQGEYLGLYRSKYDVSRNPLISIVIPNKDHIEDLEKCIASIEYKSSYRNYEIIIVENNSTDKETFAYYKQLEEKSNKVKVVYYKGDFNYSLINNFGVKYAGGEYILLLNNDTEIINEDCLAELLGYCMRDDVGIVGARLYYADGTIQHAGTVIGFGGIAGNTFVGKHRSENGYFSRIICAQNYSAVTAACMMVKKSVFEAVGRLSPEFKVAFNDVDFCLKVREYGKLVVYNPYAELYHYESKSRGLEDTQEKVLRFNSEVAKFGEKWNKILKDGDPYYNPNLTLNKTDFSLK